MGYEGLDPTLRAAVAERDGYRCRWCGRTNAFGLDAHHIRYRRGSGDDYLGNLLLLCRACHEYIHDSSAIPKRFAQFILYQLVEPTNRAVTGRELRRRLARRGITTEDDIPEGT